LGLVQQLSPRYKSAELFSLPVSTSSNHLFFSLDRHVTDHLCSIFWLPCRIIMLFIQVFLGFVASASAVDIWLGWKDGKNSIHCPNMNPNQCCGASQSSFTSIDFREIPTNWDLSLRCHRGPQCGTVDHIESSRGRKNVRINSGGPWGGAGYGFNSQRSKRAEEVCVETGCTETMRPSILSFADGVHYNLTEMDDASFSQMVCVFNPYACFISYSL
jgi:hypothetical protein